MVAEIILCEMQSGWVPRPKWHFSLCFCDFGDFPLVFISFWIHPDFQAPPGARSSIILISRPPRVQNLMIFEVPGPPGARGVQLIEIRYQLSRRLHWADVAKVAVGSYAKVKQSGVHGPPRVGKRVNLVVRAPPQGARTEKFQ